MGGPEPSEALPITISLRGGIYEEINAETRALQDAFHSNNTLINCDAKAYVLESCARRLGADIMLDTRVTGL